MSFPAVAILILVFNMVLTSNANAANVIPFHIISSTDKSVVIDLDKNIRAPKIISVFGKHGWSMATLKQQTEKCVSLCGEDHEAGKECHREGTYLLDKKKLHGSLRGPLVAIEGKNNIQNTRDQINFTQAKSKPMPDKYVSQDFSRGYRWAKEEKSGKTYLFSEYMGPAGVGSKDWYAPPISLDSCNSKVYKDFEILECGGITMLYHQMELMELSIAEYSSGQLELKFSININGKTYYVIEVSVKGHGQRLKLITKDGEKWIEFFRAPTYAAMC